MRGPFGSRGLTTSCATGGSPKLSVGQKRVGPGTLHSSLALGPTIEISYW